MRRCLRYIIPRTESPLARDMAGGQGFGSSEDMLLPPLDGIWLSTCLRDAGFDVALHDFSHPDSLSEATTLADAACDVLVVEAHLPSLASDLETARRLREQFGAELWLRSWIDEDDLLQDALEVSGARGVLRGENYPVLVDAIRSDATLGTTRLVDGTLEHDLAPRLADADALPTPDRRFTGELEYRYPLLPGPGGFSTIKTSWGCPFSCGYYCPYPLAEGAKGIFRSSEHVLTELEDLASLGLRRFLTRDATFTLSPKRTRAICEGILERGLDFEWWCETRIDLLDRDLLALMKRAGCRGINVGIETGDPDLMANALKTGLDHEKIEEFITNARDLGIEFHLLCVLGLPCETRETIRKSFRFLDRVRPESLNFTFATPYPGTEYARDADEYAWHLREAYDDFAANRVVARSIFLGESELMFAMERVWKFVAAYRAEDEAECQRVLGEIESWADEVTWPYLSVLVPTYNRAAKLRNCLRQLDKQTLPPHCFEVVVVDDGSADETQSVLAELEGRTAYELRTFRQENAGPATARNLALREARGEIVLYIGDDILLAPDALQHHVAWHRTHAQANHAMVGFVDWAKTVRQDEFVQWLDSTNLQFNFAHATHGEAQGYGSFYTSNLSLKRDFLLDNGLFDEEFRHAIWEDIELGYRLEKHGLEIFHSKYAIAHHDEVVTLDRFLGRQELIGRYATLVLDKHPDYVERNPGSFSDILQAVRLHTHPDRDAIEERAREATDYEILLRAAYGRGLSRGVEERHARTGGGATDVTQWLHETELAVLHRVTELRDAIAQRDRDLVEAHARVQELKDKILELDRDMQALEHVEATQRERVRMLRETLTQRERDLRDLQRSPLLPTKGSTE